MDNQEDSPKERFNSAQKLVKVTQSKSTSLSSSSSESSIKRFNTDTKFPKNVLSKKKKKSIIERGHKERFQVNQNLTVQQQQGEEQDKNQNNDNQRKLPHFTIFNDRRQFNETNNPSRKNIKYQLSRCKSVGTLRLPRVVEEKKEQQENNRHISKLNNLLDKNQFNVKRSISNAIHSENIDMYNKNFGQTEIIAQIGEVEQSKDSKIPSIQKSMEHRIGNQLEKIIVDQIDQKKKYRQQREQPVIESIIEQKNDDDFVDQQLRCVLSKLQQQKQFIKKMIKSESIHDDIIPIENENITLLTQCIKEENEGQNEN